MKKICVDRSFDKSVLDTNIVRDKRISYIKNDTCIGNQIKNGNYWEIWMLKYIQSNYIKETNIIDIGSNIGTTTLLMSEVLSNNCKIYSFEPIYNDILFTNIIDNNLIEQVEIYPYGLGNKIKNINIKNLDLTCNINFGALSLVDHKEDNNEDSLYVKIYPLDFFKLENVSLIKIDVENMEIETLEGCLETIIRCKPTILIETFQLDRLKESSTFKVLSEIGYDINLIPEGCFDFIMKIKT